MPEFNIKISELNPIPSSPEGEDFFPLVDSSSMTTYRVPISSLQSNSPSSSWASQSLSSSWAPGLNSFVNIFPNGTFIYNGLIYNPIGSSTCGIQEAINMLPTASNYQTPGGGTIQFAPGIFYTSQSIVSPNTRYPWGLQLFGAGITVSGIVMTGSNASGSVIDFGSGNFGAHTGSCGDKSFHMKDMFVASDLNTTNSIVYIRGPGAGVVSASIATAVVEHCWFGYWHSMITQDGFTGEGGVLTPSVNDDAMTWPNGVYTLVPVKHNLVGVTLDANFTNNCIFRDNEFTFLAVGLSLAGDHLIIRDNIFSFIGRVHGVDNDWPWTSPYRIGAGIVLQESTNLGGLINGNDNWRCQDNDFIGSDPSSSCYIFNSLRMFNKMVYGDSFEINSGCGYIVTNGATITSINPMVPSGYYPLANYLLPSTTDFSDWNSQPITSTFSSSLVKTWDMNWFNSYDGPFTFSGSIIAPNLSGSLLGTASWAKNTLDANLLGNKFFYPYWNNSGTNGSLSSRNVLFYSRSYDTSDTVGPIVIDPDFTFRFIPYICPDPAQRPDFSQSGWWNPGNVSWPISAQYNEPNGGYLGGLFSPWPIVSGMFSGTDQKGWSYCTTSINPRTQGSLTTIFSGSSGTGSFVNLNQGSGVAFDKIMNGKWLRIAVTNTSPDWSQSLSIPKNIAAGETPGSYYHTGMFGRIRIVTGGVQNGQYIDLSIQNQYWGTEISAIVHHADTLGVIKAIRFSKTSAEAGVLTDPFQTLDILLDGFGSNDYSFTLLLQSWGGIRFLNFPNLDPPPLIDTGSANINAARVLVIPPQPGVYGTNYVGNTIPPYVFGGRRVIIDPTTNEITASGGGSRYSMSLNVSGSIHTTEKYYANNQPGLTTTAVYGTNVLTFVGGILVGKSP